MRCFLIFALLAVLNAAPLRAATPDPAAFIGILVNQALDTLKDKDMSATERERRFDALLHEDFDVPRIARYVLGRYWTSASDEERRGFATLFEQWVTKTYAARFADYSGEMVKVTGSRAESDTGAVVTSQILRPSGPPIKVEWRVRQDQGQYRIIDIDVEGVSMALTERDEIAATIQRNGGTVTGLNHALEERIGVTTGASLPGPTLAGR